MKFKLFNRISTLIITRLCLICIILSFSKFEVIAGTFAKLKLVNVTPFNIHATVVYPKNEQEWKTVGWYYIEPGDVWETTRNIKDTSSGFYVYAHTSDFELVKWVYGDHIPKDESARIYWEGSDITRMVTSKVMDFTTSSDGSAMYPELAYEVGFQRVPKSPDDQNEYLLVFEPPQGLGFPQLNPSTNSSSIASAAVEAKIVHESIKRQLEFDNNWDHPIFPLSLGINLEDYNNYDQLGVKVIDRAEFLPGGYEMPFQIGDELIALSGNPIYGVRDVSVLLYRHASDINKGIEVPIEFVVKRRDTNGHIKGETTYFFVKEYFDEIGSYSESDAFGTGLIDGPLMGLQEEVIPALKIGGQLVWNLLQYTFSKKPQYVELDNYPKERWHRAQKEAMQRQWHAESYGGGEFVSIFISLPREISKRVLGPRLAKMANTTKGAITFEVLDAVVINIVDGSSIRSAKEFQEELKWMLPSAAIGGIAPGVLKKLAR